MLSARPAVLSGSREASSSTERLARSIISFWSRSSSTVKRAGTLASNGNCCNKRVQRAGEQLTRAHPKFWVGVRYSSIADRCIQRIVIEGDPVAEGRKHPLRHVG